MATMHPGQQPGQQRTTLELRLPVVGQKPATLLLPR